MNHWTQVYIMLTFTFLLLIWMFYIIKIPDVNNPYYPTKYHVNDEVSNYYYHRWIQEWQLIKVLMDHFKNGLIDFIYYPQKILSPYINEHIFL